MEFEEMELRITKPVVAETGLSVGGNFEELSGKIKAVVDKYGKVQLTEGNVNYVKSLKSHFTSLRTGIERERKDWLKIYLDPVKTSVNSMCADLLNLVAEGENALALQLDEYDKKRRDALAEILQDYVDEYAEKYSLRDEYKAKIELKKNYFNKTADEGETADDIEKQAQELAKEQGAFDSAVTLITAECEGTTLIAEHYIAQVEYKSLPEILLALKADRKKNGELMAELKEKESLGEKIEVGEKVKDIFSEEEEDIRERTIRIRYTGVQAKKLFEFFKDNGIEFSVISD